jgi:hypothetical protein
LRIVSCIIPIFLGTADLCEGSQSSSSGSCIHIEAVGLMNLSWTGWEKVAFGWASGDLPVSETESAGSRN